MSIRIDKITRGRFGNKILQYNNLIQLSNKYNIEPSCINFKESEYFEDFVLYKEPLNEIKNLSYDMVLDNIQLNFDIFNYKIDDPNYLLHNVFFQLTKINPNNFIKIKKEYQIKLDNNLTNVGLHFRGGDKHKACPHEIHNSKYYIDAINKIIEEYTNNLLFILCTDDNNFQTFKEVVIYLNNKKINYKFGRNTENNKNDIDSNHKYIFDFSTLCECDILVCSSSTFVIVSAFLGKQNKKLVFSKIWLDKNINHYKWGNYDVFPKKYWHSYDNFWIKLSKGGNKYLKTWLII